VRKLLTGFSRKIYIEIAKDELTFYIFSDLKSAISCLAFHNSRFAELISQI
jgi:hypothetical protein